MRKPTIPGTVGVHVERCSRCRHGVIVYDLPEFLGSTYDVVICEFCIGDESPMESA